MRFGILGPFEALDDEGERLALGGAKQRALLALLLLNAREVVSTDRIVDEIWGAKPPGRPAHTVQVYVSNLRKALGEGGRELLVTSPPGYVLELPPAALDLSRFEEALNAGRAALVGGEPQEAADRLREGLAEWRGAPLAEFAYEAFAQAAIARLEELRLVALEERIEADLALGRDAELVAELQGLIESQPLRERLRGQLMLALYRAGRQAEALDVFQDTRTTLVERLGIDPSPALQALERQILNQDPALAVAEAASEQPAAEPEAPDSDPLAVAGSPAAPAPTPAPARTILCAPSSPTIAEALLAFAEPLAAGDPPHELVLAGLVDSARADAAAAELAGATRLLNELRSDLEARGITARAAAFTTADPGGDLVRLSLEQDVDLVVGDLRLDEIAGGQLPAAVSALFESAPCDVAAIVDSSGGRVALADGPVLVPFGGGEHDWAALELGAWLAAARGSVLRLMGSLEDSGTGRDASRLLAHAALAVQGLVGVATEPVLASAGAGALVDAAAGAGVVLLGLGESWRQQGVGELRYDAAERLDVPVALVRRGLRPGGLTAPENLTRYNWSLAGTRG